MVIKCTVSDCNTYIQCKVNNTDVVYNYVVKNISYQTVRVVTSDTDQTFVKGLNPSSLPLRKTKVLKMLDTEEL